MPFQVTVAGTMPVGGTTGQVLTKSSNNDFETQWSTPAGGVSVTTASGTMSLLGKTVHWAAQKIGSIVTLTIGMKSGADVVTIPNNQAASALPVGFRPSENLASVYVPSFVTYVNAGSGPVIWVIYPDGSIEIGYKDLAFTSFAGGETVSWDQFVLTYTVAELTPGA